MTDEFLNKEYLIERFKNEGLDSYRSIVNFYEKHSTEIRHLEFDDFFDIYVEYANALYELGAHHKFIKEADKIAEMSIAHNIIFFRDKDIFQYFLKKKAAALYNIGLLDRSEKVLEELLKMDPDNPEFRELYYRALMKRKSVSKINTRMYACVFLLLSAVVIGFELFFIRLFMEDLTATFEILRTSLFVFGIMLLVIAEFSSWVDAKMKVAERVREIKSEKR